MGYAWTFIYALLEELQPGSFVALSAVAPNDYVARCMEMRYLSFMTLTTVGYVTSSRILRHPHPRRARGRRRPDLPHCARRPPRWIAHHPRRQGIAARQLNGTESIAPTQSQAHSQIRISLTPALSPQQNRLNE